MPIYEYACRACGHEFEREQRISDAPIKTCPSCKARQARRLISRTSFVLRGGGWYSDLYATPGQAKGKAEGAEKPEAGASEAKSEAGKSAPASDASSDAGKSKKSEKPEKKAKGARSEKSAA